MRAPLAWRGAHLDMARHFFPKPVVLAFIDQLAAHKLNRLLELDARQDTAGAAYEVVTEWGSSPRCCLPCPRRCGCSKSCSGTLPRPHHARRAARPLPAAGRGHARRQLRLPRRHRGGADDAHLLRHVPGR
ncbi:MAG: family 20 glycosylhydrolase [Micromonosporaceae bacterium]